jgi:copper chaperone CopZ
VRGAAKVWLLLAAVAGLVVVGYVWKSGAVGTSQSADSARLVQDSRSQVPAPEPGQKKVVLEGLGMVCPLCKAAVAFKLGRTSGIVAYSVDLGSDSATVLYDIKQLDLAELKEAIADAGYRVRGVRETRE